METKIVSVDAETNGLWGQAFAIAAVTYVDGAMDSEFIGRCPIDGEVNPWVADNVLPQIKGIPEDYPSYASLVAAFARYYLDNKQDADVIAHIPFPVETRMFSDAHDMEFIGDWDAPFPLIDVASCLAQAGKDPTSVDKYIDDNKLIIHGGCLPGETHNPLYDARAAAVCYSHLRRGIILTDSANEREYEIDGKRYKFMLREYEECLFLNIAVCLESYGGSRGYELNKSIGSGGHDVLPRSREEAAEWIKEILAAKAND